MSAAEAVLAVIRQHTALDDARSLPLYRQLKQGLRRTVESGMLQVEDALPAERELASGLGVSRVTVRKAVRGLVEEGVLVRRHGSGTFVAVRLEQPLSKLSSFTEDISARGMTPGVVWLKRATGVATPREAMALNLSPGSAVSRLYRIRSANAKPMALEQATLPRRFLPEPTAVEHSLYRVLSARGHRPRRALQHLRAELFAAEQARLLGVAPGSAALYIERRSFLEDGTPVEFTRSHYRGDAYDFVAELHV